eukprot:4908967-Prymnesium_polylepis.1
MMWNKQTHAQPAAWARFEVVAASHVEPCFSHRSWSFAKYSTHWRSTPRSAHAVMQSRTVTHAVEHASASPPSRPTPFDAANVLSEQSVCASVANARCAISGNVESQLPSKSPISSGREESVTSGRSRSDFSLSATSPRSVAQTKNASALSTSGESKRQVRSTRSISSVLSSVLTSSSCPSRQLDAMPSSMAACRRSRPARACAGIVASTSAANGRLPPPLQSFLCPPFQSASWQSVLQYVTFLQRPHGLHLAEIPHQPQRWRWGGPALSCSATAARTSRSLC